MVCLHCPKLPPSGQHSTELVKCYSVHCNQKGKGVYRWIVMRDPYGIQYSSSVKAQKIDFSYTPEQKKISRKYRTCIRKGRAWINTWRGYEVPGMILLCDLEAAVRYDLSNIMSTHASTCINCDFNTLTLVMWKLWR
jgi:hypothetical protein